MKSQLALDGVTISVAGRTLFRPLSLVIARGEVVTVMGPSGSGKSSLLGYICGSLDPALEAQGRVWLNERDITAMPIEARRVGILFQDDLLFPHMTVGENLAFGLEARIEGHARRREAIEAALADVDLIGYADRDAATLSGGQRARVALMRVLLSEPEGLLLDEPFSRLDAQLRSQTRALVFAIVRKRGVPTLMVTHDREDALAAGGPVVMVETA